nr:putative RNA-directed DNA polymerase [Tanacetum cinerariifolium]
MANIAEGNLSNNAKAFAVRLCSEEIPSSFEQALKSEKWKKAMDDEMKALKKNKTWDQCALPQGKKPVRCRWIFTVKYKPDGTAERYKARLIAKGHTQTYGINYSETFSPFDVKNAFLHGELKEEVYMEAPPGFSEHFKPGEACRLKKSLYGLKQSSRAWFRRFTLAMKMYGFKQSNSDHTLFLKNRKNRVTCLIIYVDDMVITGNDEEEIKRLKEGLFAEFEMKDLGNLKYFLGIEVLRSPKGISSVKKKEIKRLKEGLFVEFEMKDLGNLKYFLGIEVLRSPKGIFICQKKIHSGSEEQLIQLLEILKNEHLLESLPHPEMRGK